MTDIKVPISAPGASQAAAQIEGAVTQLDKLTVKQRMLLAQGPRLKAMWEETANKVREYERNIGNLEKLQDRSGRAARMMAAREQDMMSNRAQKKLLRMIPGGNLIDDVGDMIEGTASKGLGMAFGGLIVALTAGAVAFRANSKRVEENNKAQEENLKITQQLSRQAKESLEKQQDTAAGTLKDIKSSARIVMANYGADMVKTLLELGGPGAVKAGAAIFTDKEDTRRFRSMKTDLGRELRYLTKLSGADAETILKEFAGQTGSVYNRDKLLKKLTGTDERGLLTAERWQAQDPLLQLLKDIDVVEGDKRKIEASRALDPRMVMPSALRSLADVVDPMARIVETHNTKLQEEIAVREQLLVAERSWIDWWIEASPKLQSVFERMGVRSTAGDAALEIKRLEGRKR